MWKRATQIVSWLALAGTILPSLLYFSGQITLDATKSTMLAATIVWFVTAFQWMEHKPQ